VTFDYVLIQTFLSRKPARHGSYAGLFTLAIIFAASVIYWENLWNVSSYLAANRALVFKNHQYWRIFTGILIHSDLRHFFANAVPLVFLTSLVFAYFGWRIYPAAMIALSCATNLIALWSYPDQVILVGASGLVYCLAGFWLTMYLFIERRYSFGARLLRCIGFALVMLFPTAFEPAVSYRTHAIGFAAGIVAANVYFRKYRMRFREAEVYQLE
jgi:rhomboid protease GluP